MWSDVGLILRWWIVWLAAGGVAWPMVRRIFARWDDQGYAMAKICGAAAITWGVWVLGSLKILPFTNLGVGIVAVIVLAGGLVLNRKNRGKVPGKLILAEEAMFLAALVIWSYVKGHAPDINGLEKFMDFGFTKSILTGAYFPPKDMWFAGGYINYYYFGHLMLAVATRVSGIDLGVTFNLMLCTIFALTFTQTWNLVRRLLASSPEKWRIFGGLLTAILMVLAGNLQTIYAFTKGYTGDNPPPFWTIWSDWSSAASFDAGWNSYWYPNATRFIPFTIHEFPGYSFVVSDVHGHVLDIPIALLCIGLIINMFGREEKTKKWELAVFGFAAGWAFTTNALDGVIYLGLWAWLTILRKNWWNKETVVALAIVIAAFGVSVMPFVSHFQSFVSGLGVDCPPVSLTNKKIGPFLFETPDKCQKSPLWMWLLLWGFFWYCGTALALKEKDPDKRTRAMLLGWTVFCLGLTIFPEFFYFKDIYPQHFRSNTMFKLGYQAYMLMMLVSGYTITKILASKWHWKKGLFLAGLAPLLYLISIYPLFSLPGYFGNLAPQNYKGLWGLTWIQQRYPEDWTVMQWLSKTIKWPNQPVVLEANGDSYTDANLFSAFTGYPTVAGWLVHEWLWRSYDQIAARDDEVKQVYEMQSPAEAEAVLKKYQVKYIIVGSMELKKYPDLSEEMIGKVAHEVFAAGATKVYQVF